MKLLRLLDFVLLFLAAFAAGLTFALLISCGAPQIESPAAGVPTLPAGQYWLGIKKTTTQGECGFLDDYGGGYISVDDQGQLHSGIDFVSCSTHYAPFVVTCAGLGQQAAMSGEIWTRNDGLRGGAGTGSASGNVGGCTRVAFQWWMIRYDRDGGK